MKVVHKTFYIFPPIPLHNFDWSAYSDDYEFGDPFGFGKTCQEAIKDLRTKLEELI